jgi:hypothetical protein
MNDKVPYFSIKLKETNNYMGYNKLSLLLINFSVFCKKNNND